MTRGPRKGQLRFRLVHEIPGRIRLKCNCLKDPGLDTHYVAALVASQPGVKTVRINRPAASIVIEHDAAPGQKEALRTLLNKLPSEAYTADALMSAPPDKAEVVVRSAVAALTPFMPLPLKATISWVLAIPTIINAAATLASDGLKVEVLDGSVKVFSLLRGDYFTSNTIGAMLVLAEYVEHATQQKTHDLLESLLRPQVETLRVRRNGLDTHIPFEEAVIGDKVLCGAGEMVAVDGVVIEGEASLNTSSITGESLPLHVRPGDTVLSGAMVEEGSLVIEADSVGNDTSMARITGYMQKSLRNKSVQQERSEQLADRLVPLTFGLGLGIFALTGSLARAASILTVDYSCAVKLSTPVTVRASMYVAGKEGVLLKGAQALESLANVDTIVFDKTGTLTQGALEVIEVLPLTTEQLDAETLLSLAAGAEQHYSHPVADAVVTAARNARMELPAMSRVDFVVAHGVSAFLENERVIVGSRHFVEEDEGIDCSMADEVAAKRDSQGKSLLYVAREQTLLGVIVISDNLRPEAVDTLKKLKALGISRLVMITGDQQGAANALWAQLPELDQIHASCKPEDKAGILEELAAEGRKVAFIGDGVNDAPALIAAEVGISMPSGADLARDISQVLLLKDDLSGLVTARALALRSRAILKQSLWTSVGVNTALLALAGTGAIPAVASAAVHNGSTIGLLAYAALRGSASPTSIET